ncbi:monocarboxylate transporter 9 [Ixodes scapularis]|uniref:monocarboxylate transporter 9 n=1 Tax=Ixodes scapularis TaxID=6945 RepID=UPI001A9FC6ED|nr:monocarboxylate transporter 9 [Ixodes scapularis]
MTCKDLHSISESIPGMRMYGPDSIYSWMTAACCVLSSFFVSASIRSSGILYFQTVEHFHVTRLKASWPIIVSTAAMLASGLVSGPLAKRFTVRPVVIVGSFLCSFGLICSYFATNIEELSIAFAVNGAGAGMVMLTHPTCINQHFVKHKGLVIGLNFAGSTLAFFVFPKIIELQAIAYGFKGSLLLLGAISLNSLPFTLFIRQPHWLTKQPDISSPTAISHAQQNGSAVKILKHSSKPSLFQDLRNLLWNPIFYIILYTYLTYSFCYDCYSSLLVDFAVDKGISLSKAVTLVSMTALADFAGRLLLPTAIDHGLNSRVLMAVLLAFMGTCFLLLPFANWYTFLFIVTCAIGFGIGTCLVSASVIITQRVSVEMASVAFGVVYGICGILSFGKPPIIGYFRDNWGTYDAVFNLCGGMCLCGCGIWIAISVLEKFSGTKKWNPQENLRTEDIVALRFFYLPSYICTRAQTFITPTQEEDYDIKRF